MIPGGSVSSGTAFVGFEAGLITVNPCPAPVTFVTARLVEAGEGLMMLLGLGWVVARGEVRVEGDASPAAPVAAGDGEMIELDLIAMGGAGSGTADWGAFGT